MSMTNSPLVFITKAAAMGISAGEQGNNCHTFQYAHAKLALIGQCKSGAILPTC